MARHIFIDIDFDPKDLLLNHKVWIFGEDVWSVCKEDGWAAIPLKEVDSSPGHLRVVVHSKRRVRRITAKIEKLLEAYGLTDRARISVVVPPE